MSKVYMLPKDEMNGGLYRRIYLLVRKNGWTWQSVEAAFGLAGGLLSIILGLLLWAVVRFLAPGDFGSQLNLSSNVFFVLSLPLLAFGACCLDSLEKQPPILPLPATSRFAGSVRRYRLRARLPHNN